MSEIIIDTSLPVEAVELHQAYETHFAKKRYQAVSDEFLTLQDDLTNIILRLKTELSSIKAKNPDAKEFNISAHWDTLLDFQEILNKMHLEIQRQIMPILGKKSLSKQTSFLKLFLRKPLRNSEILQITTKRKVKTKPISSLIMETSFYLRDSLATSEILQMTTRIKFKTKPIHSLIMSTSLLLRNSMQESKMLQITTSR